jgi:hypothetical protein
MSFMTYEGKCLLSAFGLAEENVSCGCERESEDDIHFWRQSSSASD